MVFGATTFGLFLQMLPAAGEERDPWLDRMLSWPATVISSTLRGPFGWPDATVAKGDAAEIVRRMKEESDVPIRSHGSLSLNRALMAGAGLPAHPPHLAGQLTRPRPASGLMAPATPTPWASSPR